MIELLLRIPLIILILSFGPAALGQDRKYSECIACHEKIYIEAASNHYQHNVARDKCELCHILQYSYDNANDGTKATVRFSVMQGENILYLDNIPEDKKYQLTVKAADPEMRSSETVDVNIVPEEVWRYQGKTLVLRQLSGIKIEEVKKGMFAQAVISWETDNFATSEIEYTKDKSVSRFTADNTFSKRHKVALTGLKNKERYRFNVISRDLEGNMLKSREYFLDTFENFSIGDKEGEDAKPIIDYVKVFKTEGPRGYYLRISVNKPCEVKVSGREGHKTDDKHGYGLVPSRFSTIDVCYKCHPPDASHPVGVKAHGNKLKTPEDLPTIEGGLVTCVTCHFPHGGNRAFFARLDFKKDMCVKCHIGGY
ncbi:MAG: hypothetical protein HZA14_05640 [Nitrospirae bacterium]|nr:hypothetical protein [Nitrospirota bacterium]